MSDGTVYNLLKCTDMRIHSAADVRTTSGASPKYLSHANGGKHSNDSSGLHVTDGNSGANKNTGFAFMVSASALGLVPGETYVFSAELSSLSTNGVSNGLQVYQPNDSVQWWTGKRSYASWTSGAGTYHVSFKYDGSAYVYLLFSVGVGGSATVTRFGLYHAASAAWAPAEGETLAGGGASMSANLWDTSTENFKPDANGVYLVGKSTGELKCTITGASALAENQTVHMGASLRGSGKGALKPFVEYKDAAGNVNWVGFPAWTPTDQWQRFEGSCVVPSGMTPTYFGFNTSKATGDMEMLNPVFSYGSPVTLASDAHTPYATQDHVAAEYATKAALKVTSDAVTAEVTERGKLAGRVGTLESTSGTHTSKLEQLAASITSLVKGESTYTDPDGASATSGIYSLVTQTRDSVTALFGSYTKTADLASTQAVKDAKKAGTDAQAAASAASSTASSAKSTADSLATMIREDATGITVGKSADGETWSTGRTRMTDSAFQVLDKAGAIIAQLAGDGASFLSGLVRIVAGKVSLPGADSVDSITIDAVGGVATVSGLISRLSGLYNGISSTVTAGFATYGGNGITATVRDTESDIVANATLGVDKATVGIGGQYVKMKGDAFELSNPEYLLSALMDTRKVPGNLDTCGPGVFSYDASTANRPTDCGVCLSFVAGSGDWLFQLALPTMGDPHWRRNISGHGWEGWWQWTTS